MSSPKQLAEIKNLYSENLSTHGKQSKAVGWNTEQCQQLRFEQLSKLFDPQSRNLQLIDYGCGYAALVDYLHTYTEFTVDSYHGYDISPEMLANAQENLCNQCKSYQLIAEADISTKAEYGVVSGTFNVCFDANKSDWKAFIENKLDQLDKATSKGFAFNLLTSYVDWEEPHLFYGDPCYWFDFCKTHFSKKVTLIHDYPLWEWTILVKK